MSTCAVLFAKKPVPGAVKTRLQSHLSASEATRLYEAMLLDCATALHATRAVIKVIAFAPTDAEATLHGLLLPIGSFEYAPQSEGDLGQRMEGLMQWAFARGAERVVLVGSDSPFSAGRVHRRGAGALAREGGGLGPEHGRRLLLGGAAQREKSDIPRRGLEHRDGIRSKP